MQTQPTPKPLTEDELKERFPPGQYGKLWRAGLVL